MRFSVWPSPQNTWPDVLALSRHAEETGWDGVWFADHFMPNAEDVSGPILECWTVLAGLASSVPRLRLGALVAGNTYRHPAVLAKMAATIDHISGGRLVLGLGGGWQENEHAAYGLPFGTAGERLRKLEEACQVITGLFSKERADFDGSFYQLASAPLEPKPVQAKLPLLIGGGGEKVTMRIAAAYADEWNVWGTAELLRKKIAILHEHCAKIGRDPAEIKKSTQALVFMSDDQAWLEKRRAAPSAQATVIGTPAEIRDILAEYAAAGVDEFIVPDFTFGSLDNKKKAYDTLMAEVVPHLR